MYAGLNFNLLAELSFIFSTVLGYKDDILLITS